MSWISVSIAVNVYKLLSSQEKKNHFPFPVVINIQSLRSSYKT